MKMNIKISTQKIFRYSFWALILVFLILLGWLASFLHEYVYQAINVDSEFLLSQRKAKEENLDTKGLDEVIDIINNKAKDREIKDVNNIFD